MSLLASAILLAAGARAARGQGADSGWAFTFRVAQETVDERGRVRREPPFATRGRSRGGVVRMEFLADASGSIGANRPGDWFLTDDGGQTLTLVDVARRSYRPVDVAGVREDIRERHGIDVALRDLRMEVRDEGPCGAVEGHAVRCIVLLRRYVVRTRHYLLRATTHVEERARYWLAPALDGLRPPLAAFYASRLDLLVRRDSAFTARERELARTLAAGGVLRAELTYTEATGRARTTTTRRITLADVRREPQDEQLFTIPAGYRLVRK